MFVGIGVHHLHCTYTLKCLHEPTCMYFCMHAYPRMEYTCTHIPHVQLNLNFTAGMYGDACVKIITVTQIHFFILFK